MRSDSGDRTKAIGEFVEYSKLLAGKERGEAQVFLDRLFQAFGHAGYKEAGAELESKVRGKENKVNFADLLWKPRCLIEMKSKRAKLNDHYRQAFDDWINAVPRRPRYVVLCNFDELWIYDFDRQVHEPVDRVTLHQLPERYTALNFLFPEDPRPQFGNDRVAVTEMAAELVARVFRSLIARDEPREHVQRFILQSVMSMFAEDVDLLPRGLFTELITECAEGKGSSYDLLGALFKQMNDPMRAKAGRFAKVDHFNGGLFAQPATIELTRDEARALALACNQNWSAVEPGIFGTLFTASMDSDQRHAMGAHFTGEAQIQRVVGPTIVRPLRERIKQAANRSAEALLALRGEIADLRVLDPACGSGNFLYVAYRELRRMDAEILDILRTQYRSKIGFQLTRVRANQFFGLDVLPFAVELAKVTLMLARELAIEDEKKLHAASQAVLPLEMEAALPLDNLDDNVKVADALFTPWPPAHFVIGNPPFLSKNNIQDERGAAYTNRLRRAFPGVPGRADYCVYWFRKAHDHLAEGARAGLVGTKTIRETYSRQAGLDYIVGSGGTITEAISEQVWPRPREAAVHVSIVNWKKGTEAGKKRLYIQEGNQPDSPWRHEDFEEINSSLSFTCDVSSARVLDTCKDSGICDQGQTQGHDGFLLDAEDARAMLRRHPAYKRVLFPLLNGRELVTGRSQPTKYVIDFSGLTVIAASTHKELFRIVEREVLPARKQALEREQRRNAELRKQDPKARGNQHHRNFYNRWWQLSWPREDLMRRLAQMTRYIACPSVTKWPIFEMISCEIHPSHQLQVFTLEDDYSYGILQSALHRAWFIERCSKHEGRPRYTSETVFNTFPWPQDPDAAAVKAVATTGRKLRVLRRKLMRDHGQSIRDLYRTMAKPGINPLRAAHEDLDEAVVHAYRIGARENQLGHLLKLNLELAAREVAGQSIIGPGIPPRHSRLPLGSEDCLQLE